MMYGTHDSDAMLKNLYSSDLNLGGENCRSEYKEEQDGRIFNKNMNKSLNFIYKLTEFLEFKRTMALAPSHIQPCHGGQHLVPSKIVAVTSEIR